MVLTDVDAENVRLAAKVLREEFPRIKTYILITDLTMPDADRRMDSFCRLENIDPDILINNAGVFAFRAVADMAPTRVECFIDLHVRAVTMLSRWFVARRLPQGSGWLLNMSSMSCWAPMPGLAMYAATKAYIRVFSRSLHYEARDNGVGVTVACPGGIATDLFGLSEKLKKFAVAIRVLDTPEKFARKAINRMLRKKKQYINGWLNRLSIVMVGLTPTPLRMLVKHRMLDKGITR